MSAFQKSLVSSSLALLILSSVGQAQVVEVEPGYVRAPFVRVYRTPDGGTRVRAPFVDVYSDGPRYGRPPYSPHDLPPAPPIDPRGPAIPTAQAVPTEIDVAQADWQTLELIVRTGEAELENQLSRYRAGDRWKAALQVGSLRQILAAESNQTPAGQSRDRLQEILDTYDRTSVNATFRPVTRLSGFQTVHTALRELLLSPFERQRSRLEAAALDLDEALTGMQNGRHWVDYLRLPDWVFAPDAVEADRNLDGLAAALDRFESVRADSRYSLIATLPAFQATHRHLVEFVSLIDRQPAAVEELPPPLPSLD